MTVGGDHAPASAPRAHDAAAALLRRVADGDRAALRALYESTAPKLYGIALRMLGNEAEAQEIVQDVFVTTWRKAAEYDPARASAATWLLVIARNRAIDRLRARGHRIAVPVEAAEALPDDRASPEDAAIAGDAARRLHAALGTLSADQAAAVRATYVEGLTYDAAARRIGVPIGTMKTWVHRALIHLRREMEP